MFKISVNDMQLSHQEIEEQIIKHKQVIVEVENVMKSMRDVEGINEIKGRLRYQIKGLEEQQLKYRKLLNTIEIVTMYYNECEKRNVEAIEVGSAWKLKVAFKQNDFTDIANQLGEIKLGGL